MQPMAWFWKAFLWLVAAIVWMGGWGLPMGGAIATPVSQSTPIDVAVHLGTAAGDLKFVPNHLQFTAGKRYRLTLDNPSPTKHYFTAKDFADGIWSQKVDAGNVEIKGAIHELELRPGAIAEWVFIPLKPGTYGLRCTVPGHADAGMVGEITIVP